MLRSTGADQVIDYTRRDFTKSGQRYDLILDVAAYRSYPSSEVAKALRYLEEGHAQGKVVITM